MPMPPDDAPDDARAVSRRTAVGGSLALTAVAATGCTAGTPAPPAVRPRETVTSGAEDPDVALAATVLGDEQRMLDLVVATADRHPSVARALAGVQAAHRAHVDLLTKAVPEDQRPAASGSASPSVAPPGRASVPRKPAAALTALARREDRLGLVARRSALTARSGAFARVIATMAASAAQHASVLTDAARREQA